MKIICVIPSRIGSTRMPRKPLLPIQGKPMVQWVYENATRCSVINDVIVATDSEEISEIIHKIGGKSCMTDSHLPTGSDRVAAVAKQYPDADIIINLQGDEPFIRSSMLEQLVAPFFQDASTVMTTLAYPLNMEEDYHHPGFVKVITDLNQDAIYFSRSPIPYFRVNDQAPVYHHVGLYAFRRDFLLTFTQLPQTPLEKVEALEQLRALEHGYKIRVCLTEYKTLEINTPEEYAAAQSFQWE